MKTSTILLSGLVALACLNACDDTVAAPTVQTPAATDSTRDSTKDSTKPSTAFVYGAVSDSDGHTYKTIKIGTQEWMAENLNDSRDMTVGVCLQHSKDSCSRYGRLYTWAEAMQGASSSARNPSEVRGICPVGWHLPSSAEWGKLASLVAYNVAALKSKTGWQVNDGTDSLGFNALPSSNSYNGIFGYSGKNANWWTSDQVQVSIRSEYKSMQWLENLVVNYALAVRCVRDGN